METENSTTAGENTATTAAETTATTETAAGQKKTADTIAQAEKTVSKTLFDNTSSELAAVKKQLKMLEDAGKTAEQLKADELALQETRLKEVTARLNKSTAIGLIAESKTKINLDPKLTEFDSVLQVVIGNDEEVTTKNATALNKLLLAVYAKGAADATLDEMNKSGEGLKSGGENNASGKSKWAKEFNDKNKQKTDIFSNLIK